MASQPPMPPPTKNPVQKPENDVLAINFYNAARSEIVQRLGMRETTFLAWITLVGAILGFSAKNASSGLLFDPRYLLLIPALSLPFSLAIYRHSLIVTYLGNYLKKELCGHLRQAEKPEGWEKQEAPTHWDNSRVLRTRIRRFLFVEGIAYIFFLSGIPFFCLTYLHYMAQRSWSDPWILTGLTCVLITVGVGVWLVRL